MQLITGVKQSLMFPKNFIKGRLKSPSSDYSLEKLEIGEGKIIEENGKKIAVYKDKAGKLIKLSPICPHLGCVVNWNTKDKNWICPCHNSVFKTDGTVIKGPANKNLERL